MNPVESEPHGDVHAFGNQVTHHVARKQLEANVRIAFEEFPETGCKDEAGKVGVDIDTQAPTHGLRRSRHQDSRFLDAVQMWTYLLVEACAFVGEMESPGGPIEQSNANSVLETRHGATDARC